MPQNMRRSVPAAGTAAFTKASLQAWRDDMPGLLIDVFVTSHN
jgi:hypothetical protein